MSNNGNSQLGWHLWLKWFCANIFGWSLGLCFLMNAHLLSFVNISFSKFVETYFVEFVMGLCVGTSQWLLLRKNFKGIVWWIIVTMAGFVIGHFLLLQVTSNFETTYLAMIIIVGIIFGGSIGLMQWIVVRKRIPKDYWWPIVCTIGFTGGLLVISIILDLVFPGRPMTDEYEDLIIALTIIVPGAFQGAMTGYVLIKSQQKLKYGQMY